MKEYDQAQDRRTPRFSIKRMFKRKAHRDSRVLALEREYREMRADAARALGFILQGDIDAAKQQLRHALESTHD